MNSLVTILKKTWPKKIRSQLVCGIALVHLVLMSVFVADMVTRQRHFLIKENHEHTFSFLDDYASNASSFILANDYDGMERLTLSHANFPNLKYAMIISPEGEVLAHSKTKYVGTRPSDSVSLQLLQSKGHKILIENDELLDIGVPILADLKVVGWARVGVGQEYIQQNLSNIIRDGLIYIVIALLLGTFFAILIGNKLSSGLYKLIAAAEKIRSGDSNVMVTSFNSIELSKLGTAFNKMLDEVSSNEKLMGMVIENMPVGVWLFDENGKIISCNSAGKALWGGVVHYVGIADFGIYKAWYTKTGKLLKPEEWGASRAIQKGETVLNDEIEIETFDGKRKIILNSAMPLKGNHGQLIGAIAINVDITDSKRMTEQLALSESVLRNAFEYSAIGMSLVLPTGKWLRVNKSLCKMLGYSEKELLTFSFQDITWPEDLEPDLALVKKTLEGEIDSYQMEKRYIHKNGSVIWARLSVSLVKDSHERPLFFISQIEDISERKRSEAIILHEKNLSDTIIGGMPGIFYLSDREGNMLRWNTNFEKITGYTANEISRMNAIDFVSFPNKENALIKRKEALSQGRASGEFELVTKSGQRLIYYVSVMPLFYDNQQRILGMAVDFTDKKQAEQAILQLNRLYQFTSGINEMMLHAESKKALFSEACKIAVEQGGFSLAWIGFYDDTQLELFASSGKDEGYTELLRQHIDRGRFESSVAGKAVSNQKPFYCNDIANDTFMLPFRDEALQRGYRALISLPVIVNSKLEAVFTMYMPVAFFFTEEEIRLLQEVTNNIAYAIEKLELKELQKQSLEQEKRLNKAVTDAQENQRQQISMELHDNVKQMMAASLLNIDFLKMVVRDEDVTIPIITNVKNYMREAIEELRRIAHQLAPSVDETISLEEKFRTVVESMNVSGAVTVSYHFENFEETIKADVQLAMYRILQEQFSNILKYAGASLVEISVERNNGDIYMAIQDNGVGFDTTVKKHGIGLENIRRRVQVFNGNFRISSAPGKGCRLDVQIPVNGVEASTAIFQ